MEGQTENKHYELICVKFKHLQYWAENYKSAS